MSRGAVASGWCPVHDRVYADAADGVCPECGTPLVESVTETVLVPAEDATPAPSATGPPFVRWAVGAAIVGAFVLGLVFPHDTANAPEPVASPVAASQDVAVASVAHAAGGGLRLNRLIQENDAFTATFTAMPDFAHPDLVIGAAVEVSTIRGTTPEVFGASDVTTSHTPSGFMVQGKIQSDAGRIVELRLSSVQTAVTTRPAWSVDLGSIWPVRGAEPAVMHVGSTKSVGEGNIRLVSIVAWRDRIEAAFELRGVRAGETGNFAINEVEIEVLRSLGVARNGTTNVLPAVQQEQISPGEIVARFQGVPPGVGTVTIRASRLSRFLAGPWEWVIA